MKDHTALVSEFSNELENIKTSRATTLEIIGRSGSERDWQNLLAYFLDPSEPHSMGTTVLEAFITVIAAHPETSVSGLTDDLDTVTVETEVSTPPKGFADLLIWVQGEWFICIEMKVDASETDNQTERYAKAPRLGNLVKDTHEAQGGESQYVYLAPDDASPPKQTDKFVEVPWRDVVSNIEAQLTADAEKSQSRTQLSEFLQTIKKRLNMDEYDAISEEAQLYAEYKSEMKNIRKEYENELNRLKDTMKEALENEFQAAEWQTHHKDGGTHWVQLYKSAWHNDAFNIEYEPHFKLSKNPPEIRIAIDIEKGNRQLKTDVLNYFTDHLDESVVEKEGWVITGEVRRCLTKSVPLDFDSPRTSIEEVVQALRVFDTKVGHHIDDTVEANTPNR